MNGNPFGGRDVTMMLISERSPRPIQGLAIGLSLGFVMKIGDTIESSQS